MCGILKLALNARNEFISLCALSLNDSLDTAADAGGFFESVLCCAVAFPCPGAGVGSGVGSGAGAGAGAGDFFFTAELATIAGSL